MFQKASATIAAAVTLGLAAGSAQAAPAGGYALVNGLKMYYESRGSGPSLVRKLGLGKADLLGYSLGGGVALQTAIRHPQVVRRLVVVSTPFRRDGWYPEILAGMSQVELAATALQFLDSPLPAGGSR